jgi:hypothetical protein
VSWNDEPPRGGPMVKATYPGPFYPPDAAAKGKTPTPPSSAVEGIKRTLGHLGAWPWDPGNYDWNYSNDFAHGSSRGPGVAGVQRWAKINDTGWIGESTFNFLRSVLIQEGKPNARDHAMDARAVELINSAKPPPPTKSPRQRALDHLEKRVGYTEQPPDSNCDNRADGIRTAQDVTAGSGTWLRGEPWCGCWCCYALVDADVQGLGSWMASVASIEDRARQKLAPFTGWTTDRSRPRPGDLVVIGGRGVHVETVRGFDGSNTLTYGGNTSSGSSGSQSNGGGAYRRVRHPSEVYGFALVRYPGEG